MRDNVTNKVVRIGGASGFWGDSMVAAPQLVKLGRLDYLVFDFLAETTMSILTSARAKKPEIGYATDFVDIAMKSVLSEIKRQGIKVVSNAGGINPHGCAAALQALATAEGILLSIAVVEGDDVSMHMPGLRARGDPRRRQIVDREAMPASALEQAKIRGQSVRGEIIERHAGVAYHGVTRREKKARRRGRPALERLPP